MSLIDDTMQACCIVNSMSEPDGVGGTFLTWNDSTMLFNAAIARSASVFGWNAARLGAMSEYVVITSRDIELEVNQIIRDKTTNITYRITCNNWEDTTPGISALDYSLATAEMWDIPPAVGEPR